MLNNHQQTRSAVYTQQQTRRDKYQTILRFDLCLIRVLNELPVRRGQHVCLLTVTWRV